MKNYIKQEIEKLEKEFNQIDYLDDIVLFWSIKGRIEAYTDILKKLDSKTKLFKVQIIESELGFGQKVDEELFFDTEFDAKEYCITYNKKNNKTSTPDWYMKAVYIG